jgi:sugar lactone lactonase YvrE
MRAKPVYCAFFGLLLFFSGFASSQMVFAAPEFSLEFGSFGTGDGKFKSPSGLALDTGSNLLYVADTDNDRIQIINIDGNCDDNDDEYLAKDICFVDEFGSGGTGEGEFDSPSALVLDTANDLLYIADTGNDRIQIIDVDGRCGSDELANDVCFVDEFGGTGNDEGEFDSPSGLAFDPDTDFLYVADTGNNRIQIIDVDGNCDSNDDEYLANDVCFVDEFGSSGNGEGDFDIPTGLALHTDNDILYVADSDNNQIQIIDVDGNCSGSNKLADKICFIDEFGDVGDDKGEFKSPGGLAIDVTADLLYVVDTDNERIQIIDVDGNCSGSDELADDVCFEEEFGEFGDDDGEFDQPLAMVLNARDDLFYVADTGNNRIQVIDLSESSTSTDAPSRPTNLEAYPISTTSIFITWDVGDPDEKITGYKIEAREGSENFEVLASNTGSNANSFVHGGLSSSETYTYRVYAINAQGTSSASATASEKPEDSLAPAALTATAISDSKIKLSWFPPTSTFGQSISGYIIEREITNEVYDQVADVGSQTTTYTVSNLQTDKTYTFVVSAKLSQGGTPRSNTASATPTEDAVEPTSSSLTTPGSPTLTATVISETQVDLSWSKPSDGGSPITGYKIEVKENSGSYSILVENTKNDSTKYSHKNLKPNNKYTYKVSAINGIGAGSSSNESSATPAEKQEVLEIKPLGKLSIDEGKRLAFIVGITDSSLDNVRFSLASNAPSGANIDSNSGSFTWTPTKSQSGTYTFDVIAKTSSLQDNESITITVNDVPDVIPDEPKEEPKEPEPPTEPEEPKELGIAAFVDPEKDPQSYVDRYNNEPKYAAWFDDNYPEYDSIYQAVGLEEPKVEEPKIGECGEGTQLVNGICTPIDKPKEGGGCLIATAAYGSEMSPQVQFLREIRDNKVMTTQSGSSFMKEFNKFYYSFSPAIADYERENPMFKEFVKLGITPMLSSLSILSIADINSEQEMLGYGIAIIMANIGMYVAAPVMLVYGIKRSKLVKF